ncbi:class I SAM-dependent methyltransferase [Bosea thiooxidans]
MVEQQIRFNDGAAYEEMMGKWSRLAGDVFLDWLAAPKGLRWADIGCGNGASTQLISDRCAPAALSGIDPSQGQLDYARKRPVSSLAEFTLGDAMDLPYPNASFDAAVMALVIFFVPDPARGVAEMVRITRPGGIVAAYAWDMPGGGFPLDPVLTELKALGMTPPRPPSADVSRIDNMAALWTQAGLRDVETREISVRRHFTDFDAFWHASTLGATVAPTIAALPSQTVTELRDKVRARLNIAGDGSTSYVARANAVKGQVPD